MGSAMAQNLFNYSTPEGKEILWLVEDSVSEVDPADSEVLVQRDALAVIFYSTGWYKCIDKAHFLSIHYFLSLEWIIPRWPRWFDDRMIQYGTSVKCYWSYVGKIFTEDGSEVDKLVLSKFWRRQCIDNASDTP